MNVLWVTNMPTIYRVDFFNELGNYCDLQVVFERYSATGIKNRWSDKLAKNFNFSFLNTRKFGREGSFSLGLLNINFKKYDLIVISSYSSPTEMLLILKLLLFKQKFFLAVDGGVIKKENFLKKIVKQTFIGNAHWWLSTSNKTDDYLKYYGANSKKIFRYPFTSFNKADLLPKIPTQQEKIIFRQRLGMEDKHIILCVGQFIHRKGIDTLINSAKYLDDSIGIYIIGGEPTKEFTILVDSLQLNNIYFEDFKSKEELADYYKAADLFVLPTREDIWGLVINEALAHALPVITTNKCIAGLELIEDGKNGYIISPDDPETLANRIKAILGEPSLKQEMSSKSFNKIQDYTVENMAETHYKVFKEVLKNQE